MCCDPTAHLQTLGVDLVVMTPSRGYTVELAATAIIALASTYGLPVSTTQVVVSHLCLPAVAGLMSVLDEGHVCTGSMLPGLGMCVHSLQKFGSCCNLPGHKHSCSAIALCTQTGGEIGVGMCESWRMTGVNWLLFIRTFFGWVGALVCGAIISAFLFSLGEWVSGAS